MEFVRYLQAIDRRIVYLLLVLVLSVPFVVPYSLPIYPDTSTRQFFNELERIASDPLERQKVVLVLTNWGPGTSGENEPQFRVLVQHLLRRRLRFIFLCSMGDPVYHDAALAAFERVKEDEVRRARRHGEATPTWAYGEDYLDFGYKNAPVFAPQAKTIISESRAFYQQDFVNRRSLAEDDSYPLLRSFHGLQDVSAVVVISAGDEAKYIAGLIKGEHPDLQIGAATMGIQANDLYPYVRSGQLFGLLNSARAATEYRVLLDPDEPATRPKDNALSFGKSLLLLLVLMGNLAFLTTRWAEKTGKLAPLDQRALRPPLPPLPKAFMWSLFGVFVLLYGGAAVCELAAARNHTMPRSRVARPDEDPRAAYPKFERVAREELLAEAEADARNSHNPLLAGLTEREADRRYARLLETRIGEFCAAFLTLGVFAFLLGDNRLYRFIEAIIVGGSLAYMVDQVNQILRPDWFEPIVNGLAGRAHWSGALWLLLLLPGALWYFTYSRKHRWLNQLIVAVFIGLMIGPEFKNQTNLVIPQILDTIQPIWPWAANPQTGLTQFDAPRLEHLIFVSVAVLSLTYFVFFFRPTTRLGTGTLTVGRLLMMVGFGAMFGNTVNTRLSWLAPRVGFLIEDWLGKLFGA